MRSSALNWTKDILWAVVFAGIVASVLRFALGLGATTGLNDSSPWGLWIAFKLCFVALAGGGFTLAAMVYIFHLESYRPILRRAILLAFLGYGSFIVSLLFDLGLPWHIYMPILHWQPHSVMFEIAWCVMLYFSVLAMEFGPVILEHAWFQRPIFQKISHLLHKAVIPLVIAGIVLSTLHQSSLGSLFLIMPHRVHPLWYSPWIPVLFFLSAIAAGLMALVLESFLAERLFGRGLQIELLSRLAKIGGFVLWIYLGLRLGDLLWRGVLPGALDGSWQSLYFAGEVLLGGVLPAALLLLPAVRQSRAGLLTCALLAVGGIASQRLSLSLFTMWRPPGAAYSPSLLEVMIALAIPAAAGLLYLLAVENLAVLQPELPQSQPDRSIEPQPGARPWPLPEVGLRTAIARRSGLAVLVVALTVGGLPSGIVSGQSMPATPVKPALGWKVLKIDGDRDGDLVQFAHQEHQERLGAQTTNPEDACLVCHHLNLPGDEASACSRCHRDVYQPTDIFDHSLHLGALGGNAACNECHQGEHISTNTVACDECHAEEARHAPQASYSRFAPGYQGALHGTCLTCHQQEAEKQARPELANCSTCHQFAAGTKLLARSTLEN